MSKVKPKELAEVAHCSAANISKAIRVGRLDKDDNGEIELNCEKTKLFIAGCLAREESNRGREIQNIKDVTSGNGNGNISKATDSFTEALTEVQKAQAQKIIEDAEYKKQQRIKLELANATTRSELFKADLVNRYLMTLYDRTRNANKREFADFIDIFITDIQEGRKSRNELKRMAVKLFDNWHHDAVHDLVNEMQEIEGVQAK